jgi:hypothetical protein
MLDVVVGSKDELRNCPNMDSFRLDTGVMSPSLDIVAVTAPYIQKGTFRTAFGRLVVRGAFF